MYAPVCLGVYDPGVLLSFTLWQRLPPADSRLNGSPLTTNDKLKQVDKLAREPDSIVISVRMKLNLDRWVLIGELGDRAKYLELPVCP